MKISDLQATLIMMIYYSRGKMRAEDIGKLLSEPKIMIMINWEDTPWIAANFEQRRTIASESVVACCNYPCIAHVE